MEKEIDIKGIEQKAYKSSKQDGLTAIMIAILLMGVGASLCFSSPLPLIFFFVGVMLFFPRIYTVIRKRVTYPRMGYVRLHAEESVKLKRAGMLFRFFVAFTVFAGWVIPLIIFGDAGDVWRKWTLVWAGMMMVVSLINLAFRSGQVRHYVFAFLILAGGIAFSIIDSGSGYSGAALFVLSIGGLFLIYGTIQFIRFLRKYPKIAEEASDGNH